MNEKTIELSKAFYKEESIIATAEEFKELCQTRINTKGKKYEITLTPRKKCDLEELGGEFCNHCLTQNEKPRF